MGSKNSAHVARISNFIYFLIEHNIPKNVIIEYLKFHYADGTTNGKGINRIDSKKYKEENNELINIINNSFIETNFINKCIKRMIFIMY